MDQDIFNDCNFGRLHIFLQSALLLKIRFYRHIEFVCQTDEFPLLLFEQRTKKQEKKKNTYMEKFSLNVCKRHKAK